MCKETVLKSPHANTWPRFHVRLPNDASAFLLSTQHLCVLLCKKCVFRVCVFVCVCACEVRMRVRGLPGVLFKLCIKAWLTSQHTSQSLPAMTSRRHHWGLDVAYRRSDRVGKSSAHGACIVTHRAHCTSWEWHSQVKIHLCDSKTYLTQKDMEQIMQTTYKNTYSWWKISRCYVEILNVLHQHCNLNITLISHWKMIHYMHIQAHGLPCSSLETALEKYSIPPAAAHWYHTVQYVHYVEERMEVPCMTHDIQQQRAAHPQRRSRRRLKPDRGFGL